MKRHNKTYKEKAGQPPGTILYVGNKKEEKVTISEIDFSPDLYKETEIKDIVESTAWENSNTTSWISIDGIHNTDIIKSIGHHFKLDNLILEDIVNSNHRPKFDDHNEKMLFLTLKALVINQDDKIIKPHQISLVVGSNWVLSFDEGNFTQFDSFKERIRQNKGVIRQRSASYVFYRLIDIIVDNYYLATEFIGEELEELEEKILNEPHESLNEDIFKLKKQISLIKKAVSPLREVISTINKTDSELVNEDTKKYLHDVYEHIIHTVDAVNNQRETIIDSLNLYMSGLSNKMNEVMKVLTIFASIFIPLTFVAGIYGMNFDNMPELHWKYSYYFVWGGMLTLTIGLLAYFRRKKWL